MAVDAVLAAHDNGEEGCVAASEPVENGDTLVEESLGGPDETKAKTKKKIMVMIRWRARVPLRT